MSDMRKTTKNVTRSKRSYTSELSDQKKGWSLITYSFSRCTKGVGVPGLVMVWCGDFSFSTRVQLFTISLDLQEIPFCSSPAFPRRDRAEISVEKKVEGEQKSARYSTNDISGSCMQDFFGLHGFSAKSGVPYDLRKYVPCMWQ